MKYNDIKDNNDLFKYLLYLHEELKNNGCLQLAEEVRVASRFISGSATEFLHESQSVLKKIVYENNCLVETEYAQVLNVIEIIDDAFKSVGGA